MIQMCIDGIIDYLPKEEVEETKEYFTVINNGRKCTCWLTNKELITDQDGLLFALGYMSDGDNTKMIKVIITE